MLSLYGLGHVGCSMLALHGFTLRAADEMAQSGANLHGLLAALLTANAARAVPQATMIYLNMCLNNTKCCMKTSRYKQAWEELPRWP